MASKKEYKHQEIEFLHWVMEEVNVGGEISNPIISTVIGQLIKLLDFLDVDENAVVKVNQIMNTIKEHWHAD